jgi:hypothetical protein
MGQTLLSSGAKHVAIAAAVVIEEAGTTGMAALKKRDE